MLNDGDIYIHKKDGTEWILSDVWWSSKSPTTWELFHSEERYLQLDEEEMKVVIDMNFTKKS